MKASYEYDIDPRYGWASVDLEGAAYGKIVVHDLKGSRGFTYKGGVFTEVCICSALSARECSCAHVYWTEEEDE